jgi:hypothetical protein
VEKDLMPKDILAAGPVESERESSQSTNLTVSEV